MDPVRIALVGIGGFGVNHLRSLKRLERNGRVKLIAVADPALDRYAETAHGLRQEGVLCFYDFADLLEQTQDLEAVILCTPIPLHKSMATEALRRGLFVYLEKPPVILRSDLDDLIRLDPDTRTAVGFIGVSPSVVQRTKFRISEGEIGNLQDIRISASWPRPSWYYERSGWAGKLNVQAEPVFDGPATNALSHYVHLASFLAAAELPEHAALQWIEAELYRARPIEAYDTCSIRGAFTNGVTFHLALTHACRHRTNVDVRLVGSDTTATMSFGGTGIRSDLAEVTEHSASTLELNLDNFVRGIRGNERFFTTLSDCQPFLDIVTGMWMSSDGIRSIDASHVSTWNDEPNTVFHIADSDNALTRSMEGLLFSEMDLPWAIKPERVFAHQIAQYDLRSALAAASENAPLTATGSFT